LEFQPRKPQSRKELVTGLRISLRDVEPDRTACMMIVSEHHTSLPVVRRDASSITTGQAFSAFMTMEQATPSEGVDPVGQQALQGTPPDATESSTISTDADPAGPPVPPPGTATTGIGHGQGRADQDTGTDDLTVVAQRAVLAAKPMAADLEVMSNVPDAGPAGAPRGARPTPMPDGPATLPRETTLPTDLPHAAPHPVSGRATVTAGHLHARATNAHGLQATGAGDMPPMQSASSGPEPLAAPERPSATALEPQGATARTLGTGIVSSDGVRIAAQAVPMPSAIEAAFLIPARPEHRHDALTPPDVRQKASTAAAPVTGTVTLPAQRFGAFVNPAGNRTADPAADLMAIAEPEADGTLRLAATETASSALRGTTSAFTHFAPPQNTGQTTTQIVAAISRASVDGQKTTEIALNPAELGRVRLHLATTDGVMIVMVSAERAETMELLRRNIDTLTNDLKETGYDGAQIVFSQDGGGARDKEARAPVTAPTHGPPAASTPDTPPPVLVMLGDRLDLRV
jgi:hypothetical protein